MEVGFVKSQGRLTIPAKLRRKYGIKPGTYVNIIVESDGIKIIPITRELIYKNIGFLKSRKSLLKALLKEKKREREL